MDGLVGPPHIQPRSPKCQARCAKGLRVVPGIRKVGIVIRPGTRTAIPAWLLVTRNRPRNRRGLLHLVARARAWVSSAFSSRAIEKDRLVLAPLPDLPLESAESDERYRDRSGRGRR